MPSPQPGMICSRGPSKSARATASDRPPNPRPRPQALAVAAIEHPFGAGATRVLDSQSRPHIGAMNLDLSDEEAAALTQELHEIVENEPFPPKDRNRHAAGRWSASGGCNNGCKPVHTRFATQF
jgi:hypothetical protein